MFTVTFVRHGETKMNAAKIVQSRTPGELSERGVHMAESLGKHICNEKFTRIYSSDLTRCHDTTLHILKQSLQGQPDLVLDETLRERDYGDLEFQSTSVTHDIHVETGNPIHAIPIPGGETYEATMKRTAKFFSGLCKLADASREPENVLVVTHGAWLMCFLDYLATNKGAFELENCDETQRTSAPRNTATTRLIIHKKGADGNEEEKRRVEFIQIHDIAHLVAANIIPISPS
ncbi:Fructose-2,6-bisphosphatase TIGAR [Orchesella cincta]|uniref:Fructose-2,6-bisphosphatase TIGAR n=1 Tax=Orchesella cincta TaxID=48709 RepID=A0A1D2NE50_ORCCI|nr:Fructose-2,6-bisphosphatase TIGAR [Orchesella cincta]